MEIWTEDYFWVHYDEASLIVTIGIQTMVGPAVKQFNLDDWHLFVKEIKEKSKKTPIPDYIAKEFDGDNK